MSLPILRGPAYLSSPRISSVHVENVPYKSSSIKFAPVSVNQLADTERIFSIGSRSYSRLNNVVSLYSLDTSQSIDQSAGQSMEDDENEIINRLSPLLASIEVVGDCNEISWINNRLLAIASSSGDLSIIQTSQSSDSELISLSKQQSITASRLSLNTVDVNQVGAPQLVVAGDASHFSLYDAATFDLIHRYDRAVTQAVLKARFAGASTLYTVGLNGIINVFDTRSNESHRPVNTVKDRLSHDSMTLSVHPARLDTLCVGSSNGIVSTWDLRSSDEPVFSFEHAPQTPIHDVSFLPFDPSTVIVADEAGSLIAYDFNKAQRDPTQVRYDGRQTDDEGEPQQSPTSVAIHKSRFGLNCIDIDRSSHTILSGGDAQQLVHFTYSLT